MLQRWHRVGCSNAYGTLLSPERRNIKYRLHAGPAQRALLAHDAQRGRLPDWLRAGCITDFVGASLAVVWAWLLNTVLSLSDLRGWFTAIPPAASGKGGVHAWAAKDSRQH